ncbi:MAG: putative sensor-like histidine kinase [Herpetosiphonaceae bacterium]|nr:MAG: putative sensor-like histidine kinase [Herpetosiphonaceae bacterium]
MSASTLHSEQQRQLFAQDRLYSLIRLFTIALLLLIGIQFTELPFWPPALPTSPAVALWCAYAAFGLLSIFKPLLSRIQGLTRWSYLVDLGFLSVLTLLLGSDTQGATPELFYPFFVLPALRGAVVAAPHRSSAARASAGLLAALSYASATIAVQWLAGEMLSPSMIIWLLLGGAVLLFAPVLAGTYAERWNETSRTMAEAAHRKAEAALQEAEAYRDRMRSLYEVAYALGSTNNYQHVLNTALVESQRLVGAVTSMVLLSTGEPDEVYVAAGLGLRDADLNQRVNVGQGVIGETLAAGEPRLIADASQEPELQPIGAMRRCRSTCCVPLTAGRRTYGVVLVASDREHAYGEEQLGMVAALANYAVIAMLNAQLIQELREERAKLISREEEVRQQLNRDLHDGPAQALAALTMNIEFVRRLLERDPERVPAELEKMRDLAQHTTKQVRTMLFELRPLTLESQGLVVTLREYLDRFKDEPTKIIYDADGTDARLDSKREATVFNIIQESVNNALKHAQARHIWVRLREERGMLVAIVQDDGKGFDLQAVRKNYTQRGSFGLLNIEERARLVGGTADLHSAPGQGTTVRVVVPIEDGL